MYLWGTELIYPSRDQKRELIRDLNISGNQFPHRVRPCGLLSALCRSRNSAHDATTGFPDGQGKSMALLAELWRPALDLFGSHGMEYGEPGVVSGGSLRL